MNGADAISRLESSFRLYGFPENWVCAHSKVTISQQSTNKDSVLNEGQQLDVDIKEFAVAERLSKLVQFENFGEFLAVQSRDT